MSDRLARFTQAVSRFRPGATAPPVQTISPETTEQERISAVLHSWAKDNVVEEEVIPMLTERWLDANERIEHSAGTHAGSIAIGEAKTLRWFIDNLDLWAQRRTE